MSTGRDRMERGMDRSFVQAGDPAAAFYVEGWLVVYARAGVSLCAYDRDAHGARQFWIAGYRAGLLMRVRIIAAGMRRGA